MSAAHMTLRDLANHLGDVPVWQAAIFVVALWALNAYLGGFFQALIDDIRQNRRKSDLRKDH